MEKNLGAASRAHPLVGTATGTRRHPGPRDEAARGAALVQKLTSKGKKKIIPKPPSEKSQAQTSRLQEARKDLGSCSHPGGACRDARDPLPAAHARTQAAI